MRKRFLDCQGMSVEEMEQWGTDLIQWQRCILWYIGDLARAARRKLGDDNYSQVFPEDSSPERIAYWESVARAYPKPEDRNPLASWTTHMRAKNEPDRIQRVQTHVDNGRTSDEAAKANRDERAENKRRLLAVDVPYYLHRQWSSGAGVDAAAGVTGWVRRTVERMKAKGVTDVVCAFDSPTNHRKELTKDWDDKYKDRPQKEPEHLQQLRLVWDMLRSEGFACVVVDGMEADDVLASCAAQFDGTVILLTVDKDLRQCLSASCTILLDVEWAEDEHTGDATPVYRYYTIRPHPKYRTRNLLHDTGLWLVPPDDKQKLGLQLSSERWASILAAEEGTPTYIEGTGLGPREWLAMQTLMGDSTDGIKGAKDVGAVLAAAYIRAFGTVEEVIAAASAGDKRFTPKKREAVIAFGEKLEVTRQLVTLRTDLPIPHTTRV